MPRWMLLLRMETRLAGILQSYFRPVSALVGIQWDLWDFTNHHTV
jgi:hypothetical protein